LEQITAVVLRNPFDPLGSREIRHLPAGRTIREYAHELCGTWIDDYDVVASVNGCEFLPEQQYEYVVSPGQALAFCVVPKGGKGGKSIFALVAVIAIMVIAPYVGAAAQSAVYGATGAFESVLAVDMMASAAYGIGYGAVMVAGGLLMNALTPKIAPDRQDQESPTYGWTAVGNSTREGVALPELYGTCRVVPPLIGKYVDSAGDKHYLNLLYAIAGHRIDAIDETTIRINENNLGYYSGVTWDDSKLGNDSQGVTAGFQDTITDNPVNLLLPSFAITGATKASPCVITAPGHTFNADDKIWIGEVVGMTQLNGNTYTVKNPNYGAGTFQLYNEAGSSPINSGAYGTYTSGGYAASWVTRTTETTDKIRFGVGFPNGIWYANDSGGMDEISVKFACQYRKTGATPWSSVSHIAWETDTIPVSRWSRGYKGIGDSIADRQWKEVEIGSTTFEAHYEGEKGAVESVSYYDEGNEGDGGYFTTNVQTYWKWLTATTTYKKGTLISSEYITVSGNKTQQIHRTMVTDELVRGTYEIRMRRANAHPSTTRYGQNTYFEYYSTIVEDDFTYPGVALLALRALATDQLSGGLPAVDVVCSRNSVYVWNGSSYVAKSANNPAWVCYDLLHRCKRLDNGTYVVKGIPYSRIDYNAFNAWATFCVGSGSESSPEYSVNIYFDQVKTLRQQLNTVSVLGRGTVIQLGSTFTVIVDKEESAVQRFDFGMGNIIKDSYQEEYIPYEERANAVEVTYYDSADNYKPTVVEIYADDYDTMDRDISKASMNLVGCVNRTTALKHGRFALNNNRYISLIASWEAGADAVACLPGDVVEVSHDLPQYGFSGRVVSATATSITLDREVTVGAGTHYVIVRHQEDDTVETKTVSNGAGNYTTLNLTSSWTRVPSQFTNYVFGETGTITKKFRVMKIERSQDMLFRISGIEYNPAIYDDSVIVDLPIETPPLVTVANLKAQEVWRAGAVSDVALNWTGNAISWRVWYRSAAGSWILAGDTTTPNMTIYGLTVGGTYTFAVSGDTSVLNGQTVTLALSGSSSQPDTGKPSTPTFLDGDCAFTDQVYLRWAENTEAVFFAFELRTDTNWGNATGLLYSGKNTSFVWNAYDVSPTTASYTFYLKSKSVTGVYSDSYDSVALSVAAPTAPSGVATAATYGKVLVSWTLESNPIVVGVEVWRATTNNRASAVLQALIGGTAYADVNVVSGSTYYYWLRAKTKYGTYSVWSVGDTSGTSSGVVPSISTADLADNLILLASVAAGLVPPEVVTELPTLPDAQYPVGYRVYLNAALDADKKVYINEEGEAVPADEYTDALTRASLGTEYSTVTGFNALSIASNQLRSSSGNGASYRNDWAGGADQYSAMQLKTAGGAMSVFGRCADGEFYEFWVDSASFGAGRDIVLWRSLGDGSVVDSATATLSADDVIEIRVTGTNPVVIKGYINDVEVLSYSDSAEDRLTDGDPGWSIYGTTARADNLAWGNFGSPGGSGWVEDTSSPALFYAGAVAAAAIGTRELAAQTVLAKHLVVADFTNIVSDPLFSGDGSSDQWIGGGAGSTAIVHRDTAGVPAGAPTEYVIKMGTATTFRDAVLHDCAPGDSFYLAFEGASDGSVGAEEYNSLRMIWVDKDGNGITPSYIYMSPTGVTSTWTKYSGIVVAPANARGFYIQFSRTTGGGYYYACQPRVRKAMNAEMVVDGAITAEKMTVALLSAISANLGEVTSGILRYNKTSFASTLAGYWLGVDGSTGKFHVGDATKYLKWDGSALTIGGDIVASGNIQDGGVLGSKLPSIAASDDIKLDLGANPIVRGTTPFKVKDVTINRAGTLRITYTMHREGTGTPSYYRTYINGVAVGSTYSVTNASDVAVSQDITVAYSDEVQLYMWNAGTGGLCQCFYYKLKWRDPLDGIVNVNINGESGG
jgi:predicted phage tail protein